MASAPGPAPPSKSPPSDSSPPPSDSSPPPPDSSPPPPSSYRSPKSPPPSPPSPPPPQSPPPQSPPQSPPPSSSSPPNDNKDESPPPPPPPDAGGGSPPSGDGEGSPPLPPPSSPPPSQASSPSSSPSWGPQTPPSIFSPPSPFVPPAVDGVFNQPPLDPAVKLSPPPSFRTPPRSSGGSGSTSESSSSSNIGVVGGIAVGGFVVLAIFVACVLYNRKKKKPYYMDPNHMPPRGGGDYYHGSPNPWNTNDHVVKLSPSQGMMGGGGGWGPPPPLMNMNVSNDFSGSAVSAPSPNMALGFSKSQFSYDDLAAATGSFTQANLLGQGGFGYVHKGVLPNGQEVAVKSLKSGSGQGEREFQAEVEIISRVHHRHLVSLVGYCISDAQRMLVYEFVPNGTLEFHLYGKGRPVMDWQTRLRIALGSAKGLAYLHEDCHPRIIHRDIKAANILLDDNFEAMVADFGLAKLSSVNDTHVSTRVMGTFGYLAPEYASSGKLTEKSDVFSFGVMLLELLTGRRPVDPSSQYMDDSLVDWARPLLAKAAEDGNYDELVDPRLERNYDPDEVACLASCAAASIRHSAKRRPKMSQIVRALEGDASLDSLNDAGKPGAVVSSDVSSAYDTRAYNDDMMKFRKMVMSSQEFPSSEYGATTEVSTINSGPHK